MIITMHGLSTMHSNLATDIRLSAETGFDALEVVDMKLIRYLDCGFSASELASSFARYSIKPVCINALKGIEVQGDDERKNLLALGRRIIEAAATIGCPTVQLVPFTSLSGRPWDEIIELTARNVREIADIGKEFGIRFQIEPIAWAPIHSLAGSLELIDAAERDNVGMVIDFWHLWAGGATSPDEVARLSSEMIYGVHFCDGVKPQKTGGGWKEEVLRGYLPGDGDIPVAEWVDAVKSTGFDGVWSPELYSPKHWEWDVAEIARETKKRMEKFLGA